MALVQRNSTENTSPVVERRMRVLAAGGRVIVSGFELAEVPAVEAGLRAQGGRIHASHAKGSWAALVAEQAGWLQYGAR